MPSVHFSSATAEWSTPQDLFDELNDEFQFNLDPAATVENAKCELFITELEDGLTTDWCGYSPHWDLVNCRAFLNPPYGRAIGKWMAKAHAECSYGALVVCLVPARTDSKWFHDFAFGHEVRFLRGRLKFGGCANSAPFPSAIVVMRPPNERRAFTILGGQR